MKVMIDTDEVWLPGNYDVLYATLDSIAPYQTVVVLSLIGGEKRYFVKNSDYIFVSLREEVQQRVGKSELIDIIRLSNQKVTNVELMPVRDYLKHATGNLEELLACMSKAVGQFEFTLSNTKQPTTYEEICQNGMVILVDNARYVCVRGSQMSCLDAYWVSEYVDMVNGGRMAQLISEALTVVVVHEKGNN